MKEQRKTYTYLLAFLMIFIFIIVYIIKLNERIFELEVKVNNLIKEQNKAFGTKNYEYEEEPSVDAPEGSTPTGTEGVKNKKKQLKTKLCDHKDPEADCDGDGLKNQDDRCPTIPGTIANSGCAN